MSRTGPETRLQRRIQKALVAEFGPSLWVFKVHGGMYQQAGVPDLLCCLNGYFIALEVKHPDQSHPVTQLQQAQLDLLQGAGAVTAVVESVEEALAVLHTVA